VYLAGFYDCLMIACGEFEVCEGWKHNIKSVELGLENTKVEYPF
jgi:hypothetical protein